MVSAAAVGLDEDVGPLCCVVVSVVVVVVVVVVVIVAVVVVVVVVVVLGVCWSDRVVLLEGGRPAGRLHELAAQLEHACGLGTSTQKVDQKDVRGFAAWVHRGIGPTNQHAVARFFAAHTCVPAGRMSRACGQSRI